MIDDIAEALRDNHAIGFGRSRMGKSKLLELLCRHLIRRGFEGLTLVDFHSELARDVYAFIANPMHRIVGRRVHFLDTATPYTVGINPLAVSEKATFEECHDAAQTVVSAVEARFGQASETTPRLARILYIAAFAAARKHLTLIEAFEMLNIGASHLREAVLTDLGYTPVAQQLEDLHALAQHSPGKFNELTESAANRFLRDLNPRMRPILGQQRGISPRQVMDGREIFLVGLGALQDADASLVATLIATMYYRDAKQRPPRRCAIHRLLIDEAERALAPGIASSADQTAKFGLLLVLFLQRLGQLRNKGEYLLNALSSNCGVKLTFQVPDPDDARWLAETFFSGHIDLCEWIPGTERPVVVGHEKKTTYSRSHGEHEAQHESESEATALTRARASSTGRSSTTSSSSSIGSGRGHSDSAAFSLEPAAGFFMPSPTPGQPNVWVDWGGMNGQSIGAADMSSAFESDTTGTADTDTFTESESEADTSSYGSSRGSSYGTTLSEGEAEVFVAKIEWLPSQTYSHDGQINRLTGEIMTLPRRECFVKIEEQRPFRVRTKDVEPAFISTEFQSVMLPIFERAMVANSGVLVPIDIVDKEIAARAAAFVPPPPAEPDPQAREPLPGVAALRDIITESAPPPQKPQPKPKRPKAPPRPKRGKPMLVVDNDPPPQPPEDAAS